MFSRSMSDCTPSLQEKEKKLRDLASLAGLAYAITCTSRSYRVQVALFAQGRQPIEEVNSLRRLAGLASIIEAENSKPITWTLLSKHIVNLDDAIVDNDKARAFDVALLKGGKAHWDVKANVNVNDVPDYEELARLGESVGLRAGARFKDKNGKPRPDYPHFEESV